MFYAPLSNLDIRLAAAASRLEMRLSMLPQPFDIDHAVETIRYVTEELGGDILFDMRAGENISGDAHWIAVQFVVDGVEGFVHVLLDEAGDKIWVGLDDEQPDSFSRFAQTLSMLQTRQNSRTLNTGMVSGSLH